MSETNNFLPKLDVVRSYAIRRVNPFLGVLQVIEMKHGRAISSNGVAWEIQIQAVREDGWGSLNRNNKQLAYYRYGLWSVEDGLVRRFQSSQPVHESAVRQYQILVDAIRDRLEQLPFRLEDRRELWLFDQHDEQPLALLASALPDSMLPAPEPRYWTSSSGTDGVPCQHSYPDAGALDAQVKQRAGFNIKKHWLTRHEDGSGIIEASKLQVAAEAIPAFLLSEDWPDAAQRKLASQYIEWIAPSLLTLQNLNKGDRQRMENSLKNQAISLEHHRRLYPEIMDETCIKAARVQCELLKTNQGMGTM